jgi:hypothetical protein
MVPDGGREVDLGYIRRVQRIEMFYMEQRKGMCCDGGSGSNGSELAFGR